MSISKKLEKIGVAVLCGGPGAERDVSLNSGEVIHHAITRAGLPNKKVIIPAEGYDAFLENLDCGLAVMMLHGFWGEDGAAQAILERRGIPFTGSDSRVSALAMDKSACKKLFVQNGIPTPRWITADSVGAAAAGVERERLRYPLFVKPNYRGSSVGVGRVDAPADLAKAVEVSLAEDTLALVEEMVVGRELTIPWLDGRVLPIIEMKAAGVFYDYEAKYLSSETRYTCPAELEPDVTREIQDIAGRVAELVGVRDSSRVDVMLGEGGPRVLEINTLPGCTSHSLLPMAAAAVGIEIEQFGLRLVEMAAGRAGIN